MVVLPVLGGGDAKKFSCRDTLLECNVYPICSPARAAAESREHINDRPVTKPAAHLEHELNKPIAEQKIKAECGFFAARLAQIRALASL